MMFFSKKKPEIEDIKKAVGSLGPEVAATQPQAKTLQQPIVQQSTVQQAIQPSAMQQLLPAQEPHIAGAEEKLAIAQPPRVAPLFVKVDRYAAILDRIKKLRNLIATMQRVVALKKNLEKISADSNLIFERGISQLSTEMQALDVEFARPEFKPPVITQQAPQIDTLEKGLEELKKELANLQGEIERMR
jgi:predicted component of type VI protein secretion system